MSATKENINDKSAIIAVFDFDGTITTKDTLFDFISFCFGKARLTGGVFALLPILVAHKLGFVSGAAAKKDLLSLFFEGRTYSYFLDQCDLYQKSINKIVKPEAIERIKWHQKQGHKVVIISASIADWIRPWAKSIGIGEVYGTSLEIREDGIITGKFAGENCRKQEKVNRLLEAYPDRQEYMLYAYGDSSGDKELLDFADYPFYRVFA